jgi:histidyl-tRNA synthetase
VKAHLDRIGLPYVIDPTLVRGLDYYYHTAFEVMAEGEGFGAITTLCGGGRYDGLVQELGGPSTPGIGFAFSIERLIMALKAENLVSVEEPSIDCYLVALGEEAKSASVELLYKLRQAGIVADKDYLDKKMKGQFKAADRLNAKFTAVLGENELNENRIEVKNMETGEQVSQPLAEFVDYIKRELKGGQAG